MSLPRETSVVAQLRRSLKGLGKRLVLLATLSTLAAALEAAVLAVLVLTATLAVDPDRDSVTFDFSLLSGPITIGIRDWLTLGIAAVCARFMLQAVVVRLDAKLTSGYEADRRDRLIELYMGASWEKQSQEKGGQLQVLFTENIAHGIRALHALNLGITAAANFTVLLVSAFCVNPIAVLVILGLATMLFLGARPVFSYSRRRARHKSEALTGLAVDIHQTAGMIREIRIFNVVAPFRKRIADLVKDVRRSRAGQQTAAGLLPAVYQNVVLLVVLGGLAMAYGSGNLQVESLGTAVLLLVRAMSYSQSFQSVYHQIVESIPYLEKLDEFEDSCRRAAVSLAGQALTSVETIRFEHVDFAYRPGDPVLKDLTFEVTRGECIGIVGPSGSGKSTLIQLLLRLREPSDGMILVNDRPARDFGLAGWYDRVSIVPQEPVLLRESVAENIAFLRPSISQADIERAARDAGIYDEIIELPQGFATPTGERGNNLSGGQRQRVCIARALAGRPDVIVFDEPTSALDAHSEARVLKTLDALKGRATLFIIAHRLSTLNICDRVMVLRDGEIQDFAPPDVLAEQGGYFADALRIAGIQ